MKRILVINPNSSQQMTRDIWNSLSYDRADVAVEVIRMPKAPLVLESFNDYTLAGAEVLKFFRQNNISSYDGILLSCFGDPCLYALKEVSPVPVIGIAEAAFSRALLLGYKFSVLAASSKARYMMESMIDSYGLQSRNAGTLTLGVAIEDFLADEELLEKRLIHAIEQAKERHAEVVIYGCAGMTMIPRQKIMDKTGMILIDPVVSGVSTLIAMLADGDSIADAGLYRNISQNAVHARQYNT